MLKMVLGVKISYHFYACSVWPQNTPCMDTLYQQSYKLVFGIPSFNMNVRLLLKWIPRSIFLWGTFYDPSPHPLLRPSFIVLRLSTWDARALSANSKDMPLSRWYKPGRGRRISRRQWHAQAADEGWTDISIRAQFSPVCV